MFLNNRQTYLLIPSCPGYPIWLRGDCHYLGKGCTRVFLSSQIVLIFQNHISSMSLPYLWCVASYKNKGYLEAKSLPWLCGQAGGAVPI